MPSWRPSHAAGRSKCRNARTPRPWRPTGGPRLPQLSRQSFLSHVDDSHVNDPNPAVRHPPHATHAAGPRSSAIVVAGTLVLMPSDTAIAHTAVGHNENPERVS